MQRYDSVQVARGKKKIKDSRPTNSYTLHDLGLDPIHGCKYIACPRYIIVTGSASIEHMPPRGCFQSVGRARGLAAEEGRTLACLPIAFGATEQHRIAHR